MKKNIAILLVVLVLVVVGLFWYFMYNPSRAQDEALRQAQDYRSDDICLQVLTPAVHEVSGASYTFPTSCMPDGWEASN